MILIINRLTNFITNIQNICNLIGQEQYNISRIVPLVSVLYSLTNNSIDFRARKKKLVQSMSTIVFHKI